MIGKAEKDEAEVALSEMRSIEQTNVGRCNVAGRNEHSKYISMGTKMLATAPLINLSGSTNLSTS